MIIAKIADKIWQGYRDDITDEERDELVRIGYWDEYENPFATPWFIGTFSPSSSLSVCLRRLSLC